MKNKRRFTITNVHLGTIEPKDFCEDKNMKLIVDGLTLDIAKFEGVFTDKLRVWKRTLFFVRRVNYALGYSNSSVCACLKGVEGIEIGKLRYSDGTTILKALQKNKKNDLRALAIKQFFINFSTSSIENKDDVPSFEEMKQYLTDSIRRKLGINGITTETLGLPSKYKLLKAKKTTAVSCAKQTNAKQILELSEPVRLDNENVSELNSVINNAKEINGNQAFEFIKTVHPGNEIADAFNNVFDSAKEITLYGELMHEGKALINEISELRVQIADLTQKLKDKEIVFQQNQKKIAEMKQILANNPLLKITEVSKKEEETKELKDKLERLESAYKALKDRVGEGENFKTAAMFPNKEQYFIGDTKEVNGKIGFVATTRANDENVPLPPKIRSGAERVRTYPTHLLERIEDDIKTHNRNKYTVLLNPVLKAEYRV